MHGSESARIHGFKTKLTYLCKWKGNIKLRKYWNLKDVREQLCSFPLSFFVVIRSHFVNKQGYLSFTEMGGTIGARTVLLYVLCLGFPLPPEGLIIYITCDSISFACCKYKTRYFQGVQLSSAEECAAA
jgi:hypothetical protein